MLLFYNANFSHYCNTLHIKLKTRGLAVLERESSQHVNLGNMLNVLIVWVVASRDNFHDLLMSDGASFCV